MHVRFRDNKLTRIYSRLWLKLQDSRHRMCDPRSSTLGLEAHFIRSSASLSTKTSVNEILDDASMIKRLKRELYQLRKTAALTKDSQAILELQNSNKASQEDLVRQKERPRMQKQAMEAEERFKKVQAIMAKQILAVPSGTM